TRPHLPQRNQYHARLHQHQYVPQTLGGHRHSLQTTHRPPHHPRRRTPPRKATDHLHPRLNNIANQQQTPAIPLQENPESPQKEKADIETIGKPVAASPRSPKHAAAPAAPNPDATTGADSLGSGNINIALASYFPTPKPDLSTLPHGTKGDVILDIVIDTTGKIADIKMTSGLGHGIDETIIATVQQWT